MSPGGDSFLPEAALELRCRVMRCELSNGRREEEAGPGKGPGAGSSRARGRNETGPGAGGRGAEGHRVRTWAGTRSAAPLCLAEQWAGWTDRRRGREVGCRVVGFHSARCLAVRGPWVQTLSEDGVSAQGRTGSSRQAVL